MNKDQSISNNILKDGHIHIQFTDTLTYSCTSLDDEFQHDQPIQSDEFIESEVESNNSQMLYSYFKTKKKTLFKKIAKDTFPIPKRSRCHSEKTSKKTLSTAEATSTTSIVNSNGSSSNNTNNDVSEQEQPIYNNDFRNTIFALKNNCVTSFKNIMEDNNDLHDNKLAHINNEANKITGFKTSKTISKRSSLDNEIIEKIEKSTKSCQDLPTDNTTQSAGGSNSYFASYVDYQHKSSTNNRYSPKTQNTRKVHSNESSPKSSSYQQTKDTEKRQPAKLNQKLQGRKGGVILFSIATFQQEMKLMWDRKTQCEFVETVQRFLGWYELHENEFKTSQADSIAAVILLLVGTKFKVSKRDFQSGLKPLNKSMFSKIEKIKKAACYQGLKIAFREIEKSSDK